ncbi:hypothetical protein GGH19_003197 [Coemansia sp. RSA 1807]|nr:hypothetical protein GGH19_003197 [Coemansia sp. RSA 1807]
MDYHRKRESFEKVGDYLYSQDLCVGVYDGTNFNSATCIREKMNTTDSRFPASKMVIRDNTIEANYDYLASALMNLTSETQAQCVMTSYNTTACWFWDSDMSTCLNRNFYTTNRFVSSDHCDRTEPIASSFVTYVRLSSFETESAAPAQFPRHVTLKSVAVASLVLMTLLL